MKKLIVALLSFLICFSASTQAPSIAWQISLGGTQYDLALDIQQTSDGGYIIVGFSDSNDGDVSGNHGSIDFWIVKLSSGGVLEWQKSFGGSGIDACSSVRQTSDGGYILCGYSESNDGDVTSNQGAADFWIVKLTNLGNLDWQKSFGGSGNDRAESVRETSDGGYVIAGNSGSNDGDVAISLGLSDFWVIKVNNVGTMEWQKSLGGSDIEGAKSIQQTADGGYIVTGLTSSNDGDVAMNLGVFDFWLVKLTSTGALDWEKTLGGSGADDASSVLQTTDGGFIVAGYSGSTDGDVTGNHGINDFWVVKVNSSGTVEWQKSLGGSNNDYSDSIQPTADGGYIIVGRTKSNDNDVSGHHGSDDFWIVKLTGTGDIEWQKSIGGSGNDAAKAIWPGSDGSYIIAGYSDSNDGDVSGNHGFLDFYIVKLSGLVGSEEIPALMEFNFYPNPCHENVSLSILKDNNTNYKITISSLSGEVIFFTYMHSSVLSKGVSIETNGLTKGVYLITFFDGESTTVKKLVKN